MLHQNDLQAIRAIMQEEIAGTEERINNKIESRIKETKEWINDRIESQITESEELILKEMDRVQMFLENKINTVKENVEELKQYYKITKLENDSTEILLKMIEELSRRIEELEKKSA